MVVCKGFNLRPQNSVSWFVPNEVLHDMITDIPGVAVGLVDVCGCVGRVLNVHVLQNIPPRLFEPGLVRMNVYRQADEVMIPGRAEEGR
jgi:hypothetical protein